MDKPIALITGATSGIGKATAELLANNGYDLIICGRRASRLDELKSSLSKVCKITSLQFDVRDREAVFEAIDSLTDDWKAIEVLVNNAGNAHGLAPIQEGSVDDWDAMIDGNVKGLLYVSKAVIPHMMKQAKGHIINIGSTAGKEVYPGGNVYCASKHAVDAINNGMRIDLNGTKIRVTAINPGLVETEFSNVRFKGDTDRADNVYKGFDALRAEDIADTVLYALSRPEHVVIADMIVMPRAQASSTIVDRSGK